jgi:predicted NBD/HSP70 family sugar kinase
MNTFIACDFGGTKLLIGETDEEGNILQSKRYHTGVTEQKDAVDLILASLSDYIEQVGFIGTPVAAGLGVVGVVDYNNGIWKSIDHKETIPIPLAAMISEKLGIPAAIDNDVKCATRAEMMFGQGKNSDNFIYINVGTGLAAGFVVEGKIMRGANNNSGEIGHCVVDITSEDVCICGRKGCVEGVASGIGFHNQALKLHDSLPTELLMPDQDERVDVSEIYSLAQKGDILCKRLVDHAVDGLSSLIMNLVRITDPDTVILGGGLISGGWLLPKVCDKFNATTMRGVTNGVVASSFHPGFVGLVGAAALGIEKYRLIQSK